LFKGAKKMMRKQTAIIGLALFLCAPAIGAGDGCFYPLSFYGDVKIKRGGKEAPAADALKEGGLCSGYSMKAGRDSGFALFGKARIRGWDNGEVEIKKTGEIILKSGAVIIFTPPDKNQGVKIRAGKTTVLPAGGLCLIDAGSGIIRQYYGLSEIVKAGKKTALRGGSVFHSGKTGEEVLSAQKKEDEAASRERPLFSVGISVNSGHRAKDDLERLLFSVMQKNFLTAGTEKEGDDSEADIRIVINIDEPETVSMKGAITGPDERVFSVIHNKDMPESSSSPGSYLEAVVKAADYVYARAEAAAAEYMNMIFSGGRKIVFEADIEAEGDEKALAEAVKKLPGISGVSARVFYGQKAVIEAIYMGDGADAAAMLNGAPAGERQINIWKYSQNIVKLKY